jgi:hypothetical protein
MVGLFMAYYSGLGGGAIGDLLARWEQAGVFSYVLPFLLIFALVFGILSKMNIFGDKSKGINAIIALAVGLMALQFNFVGNFFSEIFPRLGMGLSIVLAIIILVGLFAPLEDSEGKPTIASMVLLVISILIAIFIVFQSYDAFGWYTGYGFNYWIHDNWPTVIGIIVFIGAIIAIIAFGGRKSEPGYAIVPKRKR